MERKYLIVGNLFNDTRAKQDKIARAIKCLKWLDLCPTQELPYMQASAINAMIKQMGHRPDKIAYGTFDDGIALLAMRNNYTKGEVRRATVYSVDTGLDVINVAVDEETVQDVLKEEQLQV